MAKGNGVARETLRTELVALARRWQVGAGGCRTPEEEQKRQVLLTCARELLEVIDRVG